MPNVKVDSLCEQLLRENDADHNGSLSENELEAVPPIRNNFKMYDADGNGQVSEDELQTSLSQVFDGRSGVVGAHCRVKHNGKALQGAYVYFVPIQPLTGALAIAGGTTGSDGVAQMSIPLDKLPKNTPRQRGFVQPGLYLVEVTHPSMKIPEQYNAKTTLGAEVSARTTIKGGFEMALKY